MRLASVTLGGREHNIDSRQGGLDERPDPQLEQAQPRGQPERQLLNVTVRNIGNQAQTFDASNQYVYNAQNQKYSADSTASGYANPSGSTFLNEINPGNTVTGTVAFDVPRGVAPVTAELHDSAFSGGVKVSLQ